MSILHKLIAKKLNASTQYNSSIPDMRLGITRLRFTTKESMSILRELKRRNLITYRQR